MDHRENILLNIMGRYTPGNMVQNVTRDLNALQGKYTAFESTAAREAQKAQLMQEKMRRSQITSAEQAIRSEESRRKAAVAADDAVMRSRQRLNRLTLQMEQLQERRVYATTEKQKHMYQQMYERIVQAQKAAEWQMSRNMFKQQTAIDARSAAQTYSYRSRTSARFGIPSQDLRTVAFPGAAAANFAPELGSTAVLGGAAALAGGLYGGYKLANYYSGFQTLTQQTAANTNLSPAALNQLRAMEIRSRQQTGGTMAGVNQAYFRALNLGYRTRAGGIRPSAAAFVNTVMQSALPSGASPDVVANMLGGTMNAYRGNIGAPRGASPDWWMNVIHAAGAAGNLNVQQMAQFYGPLASMSAASQSPGSARQGLAMGGALTAMGFRPTKAFTDAAQIFQKMEHPTTKGMTGLANIYYATGGKTNLWGDFTPQGLAQKGAFGVMNDLRNALAAGTITRQQILDLFPGTRGGQGLLALLSRSGQQQLARNYAMTAPGAAQGQIETQYHLWQQTRAGQTAMLQGNLGSTATVIGKPFNDALTLGIHNVNLFAGAVASFTTKNAGMIQGLETLVAKLNPVYLGFKALQWPIQAVGNLFSHGFVGSIKMAWQSVSGLGGKIGNALTNGIPLIKTPLDAIAHLFKTTFDKIGGWAADLGTKIGSVLSLPSGPGHPGSDRPGYHWVPPHRVPAAPGSLASHSMRTVPGHWVKDTASSTSMPGALQNQFINQVLNRSQAPPGWSPPASTFGRGFAAPTHGPLSMAWDYGSTPTQHDDYGAGNGGSFPVKLPPGKWQLVAEDYATDSRGMYQVWRAANGGFMTFMHLHDFNGLKPGKTWYGGGKVVAHSGWSGLSSIYGSIPKAQAQAHLHVSLDAAASNYIYAGTSPGAGKIGGQSQARLPTPPPQTTKGAYGAALKQHAGQFNWAAMQAGVPVGILQAIAIRESGVGATSKFYLGYMDPTTKGDWGAQTQDAAQTISGYYNTPGTPAYHNWTVALEMYNAGPYATKAQLAAALPYARGVLSTFASLGHSTLANITGAKSKTHHFAPYANAIFSEKHALGALNRQWHGVKASLLPKTGNRGLNQHAFLQFEYDQNKLLWQIADNTAKQYAITHHMSGAWLGQMLKQDKQAYNAANQNARFRNGMGGIGATDYVRMPEWVGRCRAEAEANILRRRTEQHGKQMVSGIIHMIRFLRKIEMNTSKVAGTQGRPNHPHQLLYTIGGAASAIGNDHRLTGSNTPDWLPGQ